MRLVYKGIDRAVRLGDKLTLHESEVEVVGIERPHKPESTGRVILRSADNTNECAYFPSVIGAEWIEREDREEPKQTNPKQYVDRATGHLKQRR